ncbi:hypothetical protein CSA56_14275 [candidate division KSB3 bacterium]|uniref:Response regulatory domain-containing protein n=1 Tax=candidate division KSB3 bacterium TaxID=2044937 RepID=A0A2G6KBL0_9BACT|nr:MAG: hypothetical protein CSA56_14275 [candidate division KSB3 bacterium]
MATLLVIDDTEDVRTLASQVLGEEHKVLTIDSWVHASKYILQYDIDLILLDVNMPGLSGDRLAEALMKTVKSKRLNIVLFSTIDENELRKKAKAVGALGYIPKTFDRNVLRARVRRFLKKIEK